MIKELRIGKGLSQEELAQVADISVRTLQRIEAGDKPSLESARALASALDVSLPTIQGEVDPDSPPPDAIRYVKKVRGFYGHLTQYVAVIALLFVINLLTSPGYIWAIFPALGWGVGVLFHAAAVFDWLPSFPGKNWERRQIERYLERANNDSSDR
ncbi:MAG: 2TM domain-containing protein [Pseudomonadota bacterium]